MNKNTLLFTLTTLLVGSALIVSQASAYQGNPAIKGPNYTQERHEAMTKAFANNDYNAWKNLMSGRGKVTQVVNAQNFERFAQAHKLALEGKTEAANKLRAELGLGLHNGSGNGQGMGNKRASR